MPLTPNLQKFTTASPIIASYSYTDIAEGTGVQHFKGCVEGNSSGTNYFLSSAGDFYSYMIDQKKADSARSDTSAKDYDLDFNLSEFNTPRIIRGTAIINYGFGIVRTTGIGTLRGYLIFKVRKWDGTTETEIASAQTSNIDQNVNGTTIKSSCLLITIPETHFSKGDVLRLTMEAWIKAPTNDATGAIFVSHDPLNRDGTYINPSTDDPTSTTKLDFYCPFNLEL